MRPSAGMLICIAFAVFLLVQSGIFLNQDPRKEGVDTFRWKWGRYAFSFLSDEVYEYSFQCGFPDEWWGVQTTPTTLTWTWTNRVERWHRISLGLYKKT